MESRQPKVLFFLPQSFVDFDNYEKPIQTYVDANTFVMDLTKFTFKACNMNLQRLVLEDYPIRIGQSDSLWLADYYNI